MVGLSLYTKYLVKKDDWVMLSFSSQRSNADLTSASSKREPMVFRGSAKSITCGWMLSLCNEAMAAAK